MAMQSQQHKFFEVIRSDHDFNFVGRMNLLLGISAFLVLLSIVMLPINYYIHGHVLNFGIDFRGGSEIQADFTRDVDAADIRSAMEAGGFGDAEAVRLPKFIARNPDASVRHKADGSELTLYPYLIRFGAVSPVSEKRAEALRAAIEQKFGKDELKKFDFSEGGDKMYLRFGKSVEVSEIVDILKSVNIANNSVQRFGRADDNTYEIIFVGLDVEVRAALAKKLGDDAIDKLPSVESVGAKAGAELRDNGIKSLLFAILCIMIYIAVRFDFRYGPGTVVALLHDAILTMGAFAVFYKEFSLVTIAAILTVIGYSMNDTIVVFDRIRENTSRLRDKKFDRIVNISINETLSRTILTSLTVFLVTLAMNIFGTGVIRDFAFAMNIGVFVGTYSSIFVAAPILIWLNDRFFKIEPAKKKAA